MLGDSVKKSLMVVGVGVLVLVGAFYALNWYIYDAKQGFAADDYKDAEFILEGERVRLDEAATATTKYFGNELRTDLDGDGREDVAFFITHNPGGSGTFFYVVGALNTERGYVGTEAILIGDRIAPQTINLSTNPQHQRVIAVNYAERAPGEPMTTPPSVGKTMLLKLDPASRQFGTVENNFEGEANPDQMTLAMKTWVWQSTLLNDGTEVRPVQAGRFTITFTTDGTFGAGTDCNSMGGRYAASTDGTITFSEIAQTLMACENSQEAVFSGFLTNASGYHFTSKGELILDLKFDSGSVIFR